MKKQFFVIIILFACVTGLNAQQRIVLVRAADGTSEVYETLNEAYENAVDNDALYLSEGLFGTLSIFNKKIRIYGAGHNPVNGGGTTQISAINFYIGSDFSEVHGVQVIGKTQISFLNEIVNHIRLYRCRFDGEVYVGYSSNGTATNCLFSECIFKSYRLYSYTTGSNNIIEKSILQVYSTLIYGLVIKNNIYYTNIHNSSAGNIFKNNIFLKNPVNFGSSLFEKNIFTYTTNPENYLVDRASIFVNEANPDGFDYANDYTLQPGTADLLGTDGQQVGPRFNDANHDGLKGNYAPDNPLIKLKTIGQYLNAEGKLEVTIEVEAQDW